MELRRLDGMGGGADSPGHSAKYGTYTMMELRLGKVIDVQLVQVNPSNVKISRCL